MDTSLSTTIFKAFGDAFSFINPALTNYSEFSKVLSGHVATKPGENEQYTFDITLDSLIQKHLKRSGLCGRVFSEESGWQTLGPGAYTVIYDPFCNSSLAARTFLDAATGLSVFDQSGRLVTSAIMDFQTGLMAMVDGGRTIFYQIQTGKPVEIKRKTSAQALADAFVVITLEFTEERKHMERVRTIMSESKRIFINSGHIYWLRLATGMIDGYLDPLGGEPLYEMFACTVAQGNRCVVTDRAGLPFDPSDNLRRFENDAQYTYYPVAATNAPLHRELLRGINP